MMTNRLSLKSLFLFISMDKLALVHKDTENYQAWKIIVCSNS